MEQNKIKLKPCPFCGGTAHFFTKVSTVKGANRGWDFGIYCIECDLAFPKTDFKLETTLNEYGEIETIVDERQIAACRWNARVDNGT